MIVIKTKHVCFVCWTLVLLFVNGPAGVRAVDSNLSCYDCSESFRYVWKPYTECQSQPQQAALRVCLSTEGYCKVERVTYRSMTVGIIRGCVQDCIQGCYASGFGLTKLTCVSCCSTSGCNTGNVGSRLVPSMLNVMVAFVASIVLCLYPIAAG